jgi:hypothetical protein
MGPLAPVGSVVKTVVTVAVVVTVAMRAVVTGGDSRGVHSVGVVWWQQCGGSSVVTVW